MLALSSADLISALGRVAVLMGGASAEREVSLRSGEQILAALLARGVDAHPLDAQKDVIEQLVSNRFDRAFIALHGRGGEDGSLQGALELAGIPYTGSGVLGSALGMDKLRSKQLCAAHGIPTPDWRLVTGEAEAVAAAEQLGYPAIIKPVYEGSSIGVSKVRQNEVAEAYHSAAKYGDVLVEKFIDGLEVTCAILDDQALPLVSMSTPRLFYDYQAKYFDDSTVYTCPSPLSDRLTAQIQHYAVQAFQVIGGSNWGRVDFIVGPGDNPYFIELNTVPGMTDHSLVPMAAQQAGISFEELCLKIIAQTVPVGVAVG